MILRDYQQDAVDALFAYFAKTAGKGGDPLIVMPTGSGKSVVMAETIRRVMGYEGSRVLVLAHVKELVRQDADAFCALEPQLANRVGLYSAGLNKKQPRSDIVFGGIQSVAANAKKMGRRDIVIVDEAHMVPHKGEGQYRKTIDTIREINPRARLVGFTATPYRLDSGLLTTGTGHLFDSVAYSADVVDLIRDGWLCPLVPRYVGASYDTSGIKKAGGDFQLKALADAIDGAEDVTRAAVNEMAAAAQDRKSLLIFCTSVKQAHIVGDLFQGHGIYNKVVTGDTERGARDRAVQEFKAGDLRCIVNVGVFTTGFDARRVDFLGVLRPTQSAGLWVQVCGRGMRVHPDKQDGCLVYDYGQNVERHGPINKIEIRDPYDSDGGGEAPFRMCKVCQGENHAAALECRHCGAPFPPREVKIVERASTKAIVEVKPPDPPRWRTVSAVGYSVHQKEGKPDSMRVDYYGALGIVASEWVCVEHPGFAGSKAAKWIDERLGEDGFPAIVSSAAVAAGEAEQYKEPTEILVGKEGRWDRIMGYKWEEGADDDTH